MFSKNNKKEEAETRTISTQPHAHCPKCMFGILIPKCGRGRLYYGKEYIGGIEILQCQNCEIMFKMTGNLEIGYRIKEIENEVK